MKKAIFTITVLLSLSLFQGCGENSNDEVIEGDMITLSVGLTYTVYSGDILTSISDTTKISVLHTLSDGTKTVKLISGRATLLRGDYEN